MSIPTVLSHEELADVITRCAGARTDAAALRDSRITFADIEVDSLGVLGILSELEQTFGIRFGSEAEKCASPAELLGIANSLLRSADQS
ncbi:acyl carrier protein [Solwaraspora sp. WMMD406]|uniref:phosphopantetheine-binding protein n=1 Tax=Solwaraspora sp. WMMD406 TaxID=3016095 RepID=UPI002416725D|nr:acyl carrier protein [Solwaraspora sp. WMMD406]MDG4763528.1 acyl carrier protein [Solwaraspora sp. WMMD406]